VKRGETALIVADTSIWVDFFQNETSGYAKELEELIRDTNRIAVCGIVLQEILQGIRDEKVYELVKERLLKLLFLDAEKETYVLAASIYRTLRQYGLTVPAADVTIAAICIHHQVPLFTKDRYFLDIAGYSGLKLYESNQLSNLYPLA
jgi:predicted nucleic acid-binding protein